MRWIALSLIVVLAAACGPSAEELAQQAAEAAAAAADSAVAEAQAAFDPSVFDTLTWENDQARLDRGGQVFTFSCEKCHGAEGLGDGGFVQNGDTLRPPSFADPNWALAGDVAGIREAIFVGTREGMPHWGLAGLHAESVDAVTTYILETLTAGDEG